MSKPVSFRMGHRCYTAQKLYNLIKDIDSPQFASVLKAGGIYPYRHIALLFRGSVDVNSPRFKEFFEENTTHEIKHCKIVLKEVKND